MNFCFFSGNFELGQRVSAIYSSKVKKEFKNSSMVIFNDFSKITIFSRFSLRESVRNLNDHNSAKSARIENSFGGSLGGVFLCYWSNFQLGRWSVGLSFFILHSSFLPVSGSKGKGYSWYQIKRRAYAYLEDKSMYLSLIESHHPHFHQIA